MTPDHRRSRPGPVTSARGDSAARQRSASCSTLLGLIALGALLYDVVPRRRWPAVVAVPDELSRRGAPAEAGIYAALVGSLFVIALTAAIAIPLGVGAAIYLEEYGGRGRLSRLIEINIANLAGVPSIIYGLLGLGLFVRIMGMGRSVLAGASTLALLVLPVIILVDARSAPRRAQDPCARARTRSARRSGRRSGIRCCRRRFPGILTGLILALSRAIGETAPLITIGALDLRAVRCPTASGRRSRCCRSRSSTGCRGRRRRSPRTPPPVSSCCSACC